jgi:hypothetical protein
VIYRRWRGIKEVVVKRFATFLGIIAMAAVITIGMAGCGPGVPDDEPELDLPDIIEATIGRDYISGTGISLGAGRDVDLALVNTLNLAGVTDQNGVTWSVQSGKLGFSLETPGETRALNAAMVGSLGVWTDVQISPPDVQALLLEGFSAEENGVSYSIERYAFATGSTSYKHSRIVCLYVSGDVSVSGKSGRSGRTSYTAFDFSLEAGWNLLQEDVSLSGNSETRSISIATKDVPWTVNGGNDNGNNGSNGSNGNNGNNGSNGNNGNNGDLKTLVIEGITGSVYSYGLSGGEVGIFPSGTTLSQALNATGLVAGAYLSNSDISVVDTGTTHTMTLPLYLPDNTVTRWSGSGTCDIYIVLYGGNEHYYKAGSVNIASGTTTIAFPNGIIEVYP